MNRLIIILVFVCCILTACNPIVVEKTSEQLSRLVYGVVDSLAQGRIDLAQNYIAQAEILVPIPKNRIKIEPFISNGVKYVVLGDNLKGTQVAVVGTPTFNTLLKDHKLASQYKKEMNDLQKNITATKTQLVNNEKSTNEVVVANQNLNKEVVTYHQTFEYKIKKFFTEFKWLSLVGILIIFAACCFMPTLIPIVLSVLGTCAGLFMKVLNIFFEIIGNIISYFSK